MKMYFAKYLCDIWRNTKGETQMKKYLIILSWAMVLVIKFLSFIFSWDSQNVLDQIFSIIYYLAILFALFISSYYSKSPKYIVTLFSIEWVIVALSIFLPNAISFIKVPSLVLSSFILASHVILIPLLEKLQMCIEIDSLFFIMIIYLLYFFINLFCVKLLKSKMK